MPRPFVCVKGAFLSSNVFLWLPGFGEAIPFPTIAVGEPACCSDLFYFFKPIFMTKAFCKVEPLQEI